MNEEINSILREHGYLILEKIGEGGFAVVYKVQNPNYPDRPFVAKVIKLGTDAKEIMNSYLGEIHILSVLDHPNIIKIYNHFTYGEYLIIIIDYCPNGTLYDYVKKNAVIGKREFFVVARQCIQALHACHCQNIAHRDIKPSNIMLDDMQRIKLCDFGISSQVETTTIERFDGSLPFVPPEILQRIPYDPKKSDIWSLGVTFYFLVVGKLPFNYRTKEELVNHILVSNPTYPSKVSHKIRKIIASMMCKSPENRITTEALLENPLFEVPKIANISKVFSGTNFGVLVISPRNLNQIKTKQLRNLKSFQSPIRRSLYTCAKDKDAARKYYHSGSD